MLLIGPPRRTSLAAWIKRTQKIARHFAQSTERTRDGAAGFMTDLLSGDCSGKLQEKEGPAIAARLLGELKFEKQVSERVQYLIAHHHTYHNIDGLDYQILVEADFLVNLFEDNLSKEAALNAYQNIFKTETGKRICKEMFAL